MCTLSCVSYPGIIRVRNPKVNRASIRSARADRNGSWFGGAALGQADRQNTVTHIGLRSVKVDFAGDHHLPEEGAEPSFSHLEKGLRQIASVLHSSQDQQVTGDREFDLRRIDTRNLGDHEGLLGSLV